MNLSLKPGNLSQKDLTLSKPSHYGTKHLARKIIMEKNLKLLIPSLMIVLTFALPQAGYGMEEGGEKNIQKNHFQILPKEDTQLILKQTSYTKTLELGSEASFKPFFQSDLTKQKQTRITDFMVLKAGASSTNTKSLTQKVLATSNVKLSLKTKRPGHIDITEQLPATKKIKLTKPTIPSHKDDLKYFDSLPKERIICAVLTPQLPQESIKSKKNHVDLKSLSQATTRSKPMTSLELEMSVSFLHGTDEHITAYSDCIDKSESNIIIASWNLNFIPDEIFNSLMAAKRRGVYINFIVNAVKREKTLDYFEDNREYSDDTSGDSQFGLCMTKSHAKFLFVDSKTLILGSYNALGDSFEESEDASFKLKGTIRQLWPFYMSIYETYTFLGEDVKEIFGSNAAISRYKYAKDRPLLRRSFEDESELFLLRTIKEHEDFFKFVIPSNGTVTIYSPFSTKDNTLKRLRMLESILPQKTEVKLKVQKRFEMGLIRLLSHVPNLKSHAGIEVATSHQKVVIVGDHTICAGSLNWLSAAQDEKDPYSNVELSIVLQGLKTANIIQTHYSY